VRFELTVSVFADDAAMIDHLDRLLARVIDEVHHLIVRDAEALENTSWFQGLRPYHKEAVRSIVRAAGFITHGRHVEVGGAFSLPAAVRLAYRSLEVLVEDSGSDGLLVEVAVETYGNSETKRLWKHRPTTGAAVTLVHGGGSSLKKQLERIVAEARDDEVPARVVVMTDSDKKWSGDTNSNKNATSIEQLCIENNIPCVVLKCRTAENYIPDAVFQRWSAQPSQTSTRNQVEALSRLTVEQRDHYRMKGGGRDRNGIREAEHADAPEPQRMLYANVPPADRAVLTGFDDKLISILKDPQLTASELDARDRHGDLRTLVSRIEEAL